MSKTKVMLLVGLLAAVFVAFGAARPSPQQPVAPTRGSKSTQKSKEHAKLYKDYEGGKKVSERLAAEPGEIVLRRAVYPPRPYGLAADCGSFSFVDRITANADAVVVGTINGGVPHLTEAEDFIFTDYDFSVSEVIKDNPTSPIQAGATLTVSRPGGQLVVSGRTVKAVDEFFPPFTAGNEYMLFLKYIPTTGDYKAFRSGSLALVGGKVRKLTSERLPDNLGQDTDAADLRQKAQAGGRAAASQCGHQALY